MKEQVFWGQHQAEAKVASLIEQGHQTAMYYRYRGAYIVKWKI